VSCCAGSPRLTVKCAHASTAFSIWDDNCCFCPRSGDLRHRRGAAVASLPLCPARTRAPGRRPSAMIPIPMMGGATASLHLCPAAIRPPWPAVLASRRIWVCRSNVGRGSMPRRAWLPKRRQHRVRPLCLHTQAVLARFLLPAGAVRRPLHIFIRSTCSSSISHANIECCSKKH